jgi:hypothetical protein
MQRITQVKIILGAILVGALAAHFLLLDGIEGVIGPLASWPDTAYSVSYSDAKFRQIHVNMTSTRVTELLGEPHSEMWDYSPQAPTCGYLWFAEGMVKGSTEQAGCPLPPVQLGMSRQRVSQVRGTPATQYWSYSWSPGDHSYRQRVVVIANNRVIEKRARFYAD